ncbi:MAG: hypothetical protein U0841_29655 [Chloroflexia bacterium]
MREALTNIRKHAGAREVTVKPCYRHRDPRSATTVAASTRRNTREGCHGLIGMRERAQRCGGRLRVVSTPGKGIEAEKPQRTEEAS